MDAEAMLRVRNHPDHSNRGVSWLSAMILAAGAFGIVQAIGAGAVGAMLRNAGLAYAAPITVAQDDEDDEEKEVPPAQVDKYIAVYKAMQRDHNLTVDQATAKEGITVEAFRGIEAKIERDDNLRERVRKALKDAAAAESEHGAAKQPQ